MVIEHRGMMFVLSDTLVAITSLLLHESAEQRVEVGLKVPSRNNQLAKSQRLLLLA